MALCTPAVCLSPVDTVLCTLRCCFTPEREATDHRSSSLHTRVDLMEGRSIFQPSAFVLVMCSNAHFLSAACCGENSTQWQADRLQIELRSTHRSHLIRTTACPR